jgi:hypothetical protein
MKQIKYSFVLFLALFAMTMAFGCAHTGTKGTSPTLIATSEAFKLFKGEFENTEYFLKHKPKTIAVLPFQDLERKKYSLKFTSDDPAGVVRRGMYNHISSLPFKDLEIFDTDKRLKNAGFKDTRDIQALIDENPKKLKSILNVDAVVTGQVTHFDRIFVGIYSQVAVGCEVRMWDLKNGELLWRAKHVSRAHAGGLSLSPVGLIMATIASVWNLRETEMLSQTDELFREIVSTVDAPKSVLASQLPPPRIDLFAVMNSGKPFTLGQKPAYRLIGDPECSAYVDLGDFKSSLDLAPVGENVKKALRVEVLDAIKKTYKETGHTLTPELIAAVEKELATRQIYEGHYTVEPNEEAYGLIAKAYLVNSAGIQNTSIDAAHFVDIDSLPPAMPAGAVAESLDEKIKLRWAASPEEDLAGYEVWQSASPLSGYALVKKTEKNETLVDNLVNFSKSYFQIRAVDRATNSGKFSKTIEALPLPDPGLYDLPRPGPTLGGEINKKVLLVAEKNPYTVLSDVEVVQGGVLYVEPGVELLFAPDTALRVAGGDVLVYGQKAKPVQLVPKTMSGKPGAWRGVVLDGAGRCALRHVVIKGADTGLTIADSAPTVASATITGCAQAGVYLQDRARPNITCSVLAGNEGQGGLVIEGEGVAPVIRNNVFENNQPFQVQSYTPIQIDLSGNYWGRSVPDADWFLGDLLFKPALSEPPAACSLP